MGTALQNKSKIALFVCMIVILFFSFYGYDRNFQLDSELLASGPMMAKMEGIPKSDKYGLGRYHDVNKSWMNYSKPVPQICVGFDNGYAQDKPVIVISNNYYTNAILPKAKAIRFPKGQKVSITDFSVKDKQMFIELNSNMPLSKQEYGDITKIQFIDKDGESLPSAAVSDYSSQFGLQGFVFTTLENHMLSFHFYKKLYKGACILALSLVLGLIIWCIWRKYDFLLAFSFFIVFVTSSWIRNFSSNLYWVEFTWFIPMLIGIWASLHVKNNKVKIAAYLMSFIALLIKSLCGYEYISTIMMGLIAFPLTDCIYFHLQHRTKERNQAFWLLVGLGIFALAGFIAALMIHGYVRGEGNVWQGIVNIYERDVLRRTWGGNANILGQAYAASFNAGAFTVLKTYIFRWHSEIFGGLPGSLFPLVAISPIIIWLMALQKHMFFKFDVRIVILYFVFFLTSISWFVLAKSHSFIHTHMNYVLWYFGFIQICLYGWLEVVKIYLMDKGVINAGKHSLKKGEGE